MLTTTPHILPREDADAAAIVERRLRATASRLVHGAHDRARRSDAARDARCATCAARRRAEDRRVDAILVGVGRAPNVEGLGLETAGVAYDARAASRRRPPAHHQPAHLRRRRRLHRAASSPTPPTARRASSIQNALFLRPQEGQRAAHALVHLHRPGGRPRRPLRARRRGARHRGRHAHACRSPRSTAPCSTARTRASSSVHVRKGTRPDRRRDDRGRARRRDDLRADAGDGRQARPRQPSPDVIHPYPTQAEVIKKAGDAYNRTRLTPHGEGALRVVARDGSR